MWIKTSFFLFAFLFSFKHSCMVLKKENIFSYYSSADEESALRPCAFKGCVSAGLHKALRHPEQPKNCLWLCSDHIILHNRRSDYFAGMSSADIEKEIRADFLWRRPTWPLGAQRQKFSYYFEDPLEIERKVQRIKEGVENTTFQQPCSDLPVNVREALEILQLKMPVTLEGLKKAYKIQVKKYHPDVNKGSKEAETKFKKISAVYKLLQNYLF